MRIISMSIIRQFTPNWFTVTMGTGILALLLGQLPGPLWLHAAGAELWRINIALFGLFSLLYAARWVLYPREAARIFGHAVMPMFLGAIPMGLATIVNGSILFGHDYGMALWLWGADAVLAALVGLGVPFAMFTRQTHRLESMTGVWLLPIVAAEVAAASAGLLAPHLAGPAALDVLLAGYVLWALSVPLALSVLVILFLRLVLHKLPHRDMAASGWLALGPLGTGALALLLLGRAAPGILSPLGMADAGQVAHGLGLIGGLMLWGYGGWWLLIAVAMTCAYLARGLPFNLGWWGFIFPLGVFTAASFALGAQTGVALFSQLAVAQTALVGGLWLVVSLRTVAGAVSGVLFHSPCLSQPLAPLLKSRETPDRIVGPGVASG
jgi:C4-dicarboxylate transporter/malic acid transport protein